jgi:predicted membrane protein
MRHIVFVGILGFGFTFTFLGIMLRMGKLRWIYAGRSLPVYAQREVANVFIPIGLGIFVIAFLVAFPDLKDLFTYPLAFLFFTYLVLAVWQPEWLKPAWLRWLEKNYGHVLEEMFAEARAMGRRNWAEQVKTQESLERWADSVAQKHGWQRRA